MLLIILASLIILANFSRYIIGPSSLLLGPQLSKVNIEILEELGHKGGKEGGGREIEERVVEEGIRGHIILRIRTVRVRLGL